MKNAIKACTALGRTAAAGVLLCIAASTFVVAGTTVSAAAANVAFGQCNYDETGAARDIRCDVSVVNNLDVATGVTSSSVTTTICAGAPDAPLCGSPVTSASSDIVISINQCNNSVNAGGSKVICNVSVVNNITGAGSTSPATVNQCIGSAASGAPTCNPTSSTTGADITQCNGSGNGGTLVHFECTVNTSTVSSLLPITVQQCNDSANGGGGYVTCQAQITTNLLAPPATTTPVTTAPSGGTAPGETTTPTSDTTGGTTPEATTPITRPLTTVPPTKLPETGSTSTGSFLAFGVTAAGVLALIVARRRLAR